MMRVSEAALLLAAAIALVALLLPPPGAETRRPRRAPVAAGPRVAHLAGLATEDADTVGPEPALGSPAARDLWRRRSAAVVEAFRHAWRGYSEAAMGRDELLPVSRRGRDSYGLALTLVDALDTAMLMRQVRQRRRRARTSCVAQRWCAWLARLTPSRTHRRTLWRSAARGWPSTFWRRCRAPTTR
jgi:hypothetical protein